MNQNKIKKYDTENVFGSINLFPKQCFNSWENTKYQTNNKPIKNVLVIGMGGSTLGAYIIKSLNVLTVPITISNDYHIPVWVNEETLVLATSYSGGTEETISGTKDALNSGANVVGITTGGELAEMLNEKNLPVCIIDTKDNPCGQPRFGTGSIMMTILKICITHNICTLSKEEIENGITELMDWKNKESEKILSGVYKRAKLSKNKTLVVVSSNHLANVGRFTRNQIHETSKTLALSHEIPELNHHLMEGLEFPKKNPKSLQFIFLESNLYSDKIQKRYEVTKMILDKQKIKHYGVEVAGETPFSQVLISMIRGMYFAFSLSFVHKKNPVKIPWVNYFKEQLSK